MSEHPSVRFYNILMGFQVFAGKSLRATDHAEVLTSAELDAMEAGLRRMAVSLRKEDANEWPDLHKLADQINKWLPETEAING